jgi:DNA-binding NtrC family response regulator
MTEKGQARRNAAGAADGRGPQGDRPTVLVVDDDKLIVDALRALLEGEGYPVKTAANGTEAYNLIKTQPAGCMLLDVNMPHISGVELLLLMQTEDIRIPTILMAGFRDFSEHEMKNFTNVVKFLPKPFALDDMLDAVRAHTAAEQRV